ncbi:MAG TPA: ribosome silencing factor [Gemmatimonadales bacterium]|jgi:ribosome-associated protein
MRKKPPVRPIARRPRRPNPAINVSLDAAVAACGERKALDGVVIDLRHLSDAADYFVVVSGTSDTHVRAIAEYVIETLGAAGLKPYQVEGLNQGRWVLVDYVDTVVHVFHPTLRSFYQLEGLWGDAPQRRF